jgi:hypothetical protein
VNILNENDIVRILITVKANVIGENRTLFIPKNSVGTIVLVYEKSAYEIEFFVPDQNVFALATISVEDVNIVDK